ncbi:hypothetical protein Tcan_18527 [Toxocara canis]|uniref:ZP domain-containing protein n=1 Tax=Toxocara canis TaxID=6265 RepID=A0A0B2W2S7_TOXCA|nr:hypothetical protein Tcan_18527 [Toxocara canis]
MWVSTVLLLLYAYFTRSLDGHFLNVDFGLKLREVKRVDAILNSISQPIVIVVNATAIIDLYGSFCESKQGKLIYSGNGFINKAISSSLLYELLETTKCDSDLDPFYEKLDEHSRVLYFTVVGKSTPVANVSLSVTSRLRREERSEPLPKAVMSEHFDIEKNASIRRRFPLASYETGVEIVFTFDERFESDVLLYLSSCVDIQGDLIEKVSSNCSSCSVHMNASSVIELVERTKCANDKDAIYDDPTNVSRFLFLRLLSVSDRSIGDIAVLNGIDPQPTPIVDETSKIELANGQEIFLNGTFENVPQNETRHLTGTIADIKKGIELHLIVVEGHFEMTASFCDSKLPVLRNSYAIGEFMETLNDMQLQDAVTLANCVKKTKRSTDNKNTDEVSPYLLRISLLGKLKSNSATLYAVSGIQPMNTLNAVNRSSSIWDDIGIWGYLAIGTVLFTITIVILIVSLLSFRHFCPGSLVRDPVETIDAYVTTHNEQKIEDETSRTWI